MDMGTVWWAMAVGAVSLVCWFIGNCLVAAWAPAEAISVAELRGDLRSCLRKTWAETLPADQLRNRWLGLGYLLLGLVAGLLEVEVNRSRLPVVFAIGITEGLLLSIALPILAAGAGLLLHAALKPPAPGDQPDLVSLSLSRRKLIAGALMVATLSGGFLIAERVHSPGALLMGIVLAIPSACFPLLMKAPRGDVTIHIAKTGKIRPIPFLIAIILLGCNMGVQGFANYAAVTLLLEQRNTDTLTEPTLAPDDPSTEPAAASSADPLAALPWVFAMLSAVLALSEAVFTYHAKTHVLEWRVQSLKAAGDIENQIAPLEKELRHARTLLRAEIGRRMQIGVYLWREIRRYNTSRHLTRSREARLRFYKNQMMEFIRVSQELSQSITQRIAAPRNTLPGEARMAVRDALQGVVPVIVGQARSAAESGQLEDLSRLITEMVAVFGKARSDLQEQFPGNDLDPRETEDLLKVLNSLKAERARAIAAFQAGEARRFAQTDQNIRAKVTASKAEATDQKKEERN